MMKRNSPRKMASSVQRRSSQRLRMRAERGKLTWRAAWLGERLGERRTLRGGRRAGAQRARLRLLVKDSRANAAVQAWPDTNQPLSAPKAPGRELLRSRPPAKCSHLVDQGGRREEPGHVSQREVLWELQHRPRGVGVRRAALAWAQLVLWGEVACGAGGAMGRQARAHGVVVPYISTKPKQARLHTQLTYGRA